VARALVTGAGREGNIAAAVVRALERDGWSIATTDIEGDVTVRADLGDPDAPRRIRAEIGPVEALVACHTVSELGGLLETTADQIDRHLSVNVRGTLLLIAEFVRGLPGDWGRIVTFTSGLPLHGEIAYAASKGAIAWLSVAAAVDLGPRGVTVNAIDPGPTDTGWMGDELKEAIIRSTPLGRAGRPEDAAELVAFLCSPRGGWITGRVLRSDGGFSWTTMRRGGELL
jgi:3-oxoacyl-[acyl-carrier protein] reductase